MWINWTLGLPSIAPLSTLGHNKHKSLDETLMIPNSLILDPSFMKHSPEVKQSAEWGMIHGRGSQQAMG